MKKRSIITAFTLISLWLPHKGNAQGNNPNNGYFVSVCVYNGDTIPYIELPTLYVFKPIPFKNEKARREYDKLVRDVKKVFPLSQEVRRVLIETYEYMQTLPDTKSKQKHIKAVEKGVKEQYTAQMKRLTFSQGKLLIKLIDRECSQTSFDLIKAFMGSFKAGFYQVFAGLFGASLKEEYDPQGKDRLIERTVLMVESGQI